MYDGFFSILRKPNEDVELPKDASDAQQYVDKAMIQWRVLGMKITIKGHASAAHAVQQFIAYKGLANMAEDFLERQHQLGVTFKRRSANITNMTEECMCHAQWEQLRSIPKLNEIQKAVVEGQKRKNLKNVPKSIETK